ncbi:MAG: glycosyl transferase family 2 [Candidatus Rokuibacteriota bacterium]|nr:MAG: glycosyl transferase family 2 [Candidatus Rokubacteria bacterium]
MLAYAIFWTCLSLVSYTYLLYPCVLFVIYAFAQARTDLRFLSTRRDRRRRALADGELPPVTLIVPAHNEEAHLKDKVANVQELDYPRGRLQVILVSDGSTDRTNEILAAVDDPAVETLLLSERAGKATALNRALERARHGILVFSDASTLFHPDAIKQLVRHFADPRVGVVCGALGLRGGDEFSRTEGIYWRYETSLRLMEARLGATLTASGAIYAVRRECYRPLTPDDVIDDFVIPMRARALGFQVVFDPEAQAVEFAGESVREEFTRRVRIAAGSFRALRELAQVPLAPLACLAFFSHKILRWVLPFLLIGLLAANLFLIEGGPFYLGLLAAQCAFYLWAGVGFLFRERARPVPLAPLCYFLVAINVAFLVGFLRFLGGHKETAWQRVS